MNGFMVFIYFVFFAIIAGGAFALMWSNIQSINKMMDEVTPSNITICDAHRIHYLPHHTANLEVQTDDMQDYEDEWEDPVF